MPERELFELWLASEAEIREIVPGDNMNNSSLSRNFADFMLQHLIKGFSPSLLRKNEHGKPYIKDLPFSYNLSHCDDLYAILVTSFDYCGVDIQSVKSHVKYDDALRSVMTDREYGILKEKGNPGDFFQLWSLKEAYVKALGGSIWFGRDFETETAPGNYSDTWFKREKLFFYSTEVKKDFFLSLAVPALPETADFLKFLSKDFS